MRLPRRISPHARAHTLENDRQLSACCPRALAGSDPPYFVNAYRISGLQGRLIPRTTGLDFPDLGTWRTLTVAGRKVAVGDDSMFDQAQDSHIRPYVWNSGQVHYMIVTDDDAWAAEVLGQLE